MGLFDLIKLDSSNSGNVKYKKEVTDDELREWLKEKYHEVQWTGEKFKVKPMDLCRLNKNELKQH